MNPWFTHEALCERSTAAARLLCIRVLENKALPHQRVFPVQRHAVQVNERFGVDKYTNVFKGEDSIPFARLSVEADQVRQPRAASTLHPQTKSALVGGNAFLLQSRADVQYRFGR